ncbi:MAG TPA: hypothetical protein VMJ32_11400 [Pirellulales bacterium]|nr:hypothetical protein [Pirellulales bacterium]
MKYLAGFCVFALTVLTLSNAAQAQQPFSNVQSSPTVSPYLNLTNRGNGGLANYQTLVQPFLQQQQTNIQQQQQIQGLQKQQQATLTGPESRGISNTIRGTGHVTAYMDYLHYYQRPGTGYAQAPRQ